MLYKWQVCPVTYQTLLVEKIVNQVWIYLIQTIRRSLVEGNSWWKQNKIDIINIDMYTIHSAFVDEIDANCTTLNC